MAVGAALIGKALQPGPQTWRKTEAFEALFYVRMLFSALVGILFGVAGAQGVGAFCMFIGATWMCGRWWLTYQGIDPEEWETSETQTPLHAEGLVQGIMCFLLTWIVSFSMRHFG